MSEEMNEMNDMGGGAVEDSDKTLVLLGYIFPIVAIVMLLMEEKKAKPFIKYHSVLALMFGALTFVLSFTACGWIITWIWGIYVGWQAYSTGELVEVAYLSDFARKQGWV